MRTPRTLLAAFATTIAIAFTPAFADTVSQNDSVDFQLDLQAPADAIYKSIRQQAWEACAPASSSPSVTFRTTLRRKCQKQLVRDVVETLSEPEVIRLAEADGVHTKS